MTHKKIRIPKESANEIMMALGKLNNCIEFEDLTKNDLEAKKNFGEMIKRCDEMKKKIGDYKYISSEFKIPFNNFSCYAEFDSSLTQDMQERDKKFGSTYFDLIENEVLENERKINELVDSHTQLRDDLVILIEKKHVLAKASELIRDNIAYGNFGDSDADEDGINASNNSNLVLLAGTVPTENELKMKRMIFRVSRGNAITAFYGFEINRDEYLLTSTVRQRGFTFANKKPNILIEKDDNILLNNEMDMINTKKKIFSIVFTGGEENILLKKILKVCEIFQASRFPLPRNQKINEEINLLNRDIADKRNMIITIEKNINDLIIETNKFKGRNGYKYSLYRLFFEQQRLIYSNMGKCILRENFIDGKVWIPVNKVPIVESTLNNLFIGQENKVTAHLENIDDDDNKTKYPTLIYTNDFTCIPQLIVDTYGIPRYQEINPGYFAIITFPFLFGVMFGDIGHSIFLLIFAFYLIYNNKEFSLKKKSIFNTITKARYFILLMGFFSLFCGLLYNDFLSVPLYFKSCYPKQGEKEDHLSKKENCRYSFGLDPVWTVSSNELIFVNSLKMKFSVIFGVFQMILGIILKGLNALHENDLVEYIFVFIPQLIFMIILFGYMDFLIFLKWSTNYDEKLNQAPDIKSYLMNIFLDWGKLPKEPEEDKDWVLLGERKFTETIHICILILSIFCLIIMFFPKIFLNYSKAKEKRKFKRIINIRNNIDDNMNDNLLPNENLNINNEEAQEPSLSDFFVASVIETIEFALGSVSNTASYLRLWALSLAHSQLSSVFFKYSIGLVSMITDYYFVNGLLLSIIFILFAAVTFGVLLCMDCMECFLHTLRLHWVEFQNKFYKADGYKFQPFCFEVNIELNDDEFS